MNSVRLLKKLKPPKLVNSQKHNSYYMKGEKKRFMGCASWWVRCGGLVEKVRVIWVS